MDNNSMDALNTLLSDPAALSAAMEMAKGLFAGAATPQAKPSDAADPPATPVEPTANIAQDDDKTRLLLALKPFLSPKRSEKVGTVITLMRAMQIMGNTSFFKDGGK